MITRPIDRDCLRRIGWLCALLCCSVSAHGKLQLDGVEGKVERNILAHLSLDDEPCDAPRFRIRQRYRTLEQRVREAVSPYGYYAPTIRREISFDEECWLVAVEVALGEPVRIRKLEVRISGAAGEDSKFADIRVDDYLEVGEPFVHAQYEGYKRVLADLAQERGYFDAEFAAHRVTVERQALAADLELEFASGNRYRYGQVTYASHNLSERLLHRFPTFAADEFYRQDEVTQLYSDLLATEYFEMVHVDKVPRDDERVDVSVDLVPAKRWRLGAGVGFGTDVGPSVSGTVLNRRVNRRGHRAEWKTDLATVEQETIFDYRIPGRRPASDWYSLYAGYRARNSDALTTRGWHTGIRHGKRLTKNLFETRFGEFSHERILEDGEWRYKNSLVPGINWNYQLGGRSPRPRSGLRAMLEFAGASRHVVSDASFVRARLRVKSVLPASRQSRFLLRGEVGRLYTNDFDSIPPSWRFYAGGDSSVRGYDYQSLGPADEDGEATGGSRLLVGSAEFDFPIRGNWSAAVFTDGGSVSRNKFGSGFQWSYGVGARWFSPLGPVRVDFAIPQQAGRSFRIHISLGPDL